MRAFNPSHYGPVLAPLVSGDRCRALDHGAPCAQRRADLAAASVDAAFAHARVVDRDMAACTIAGLCLLHDELDRSHTISQNVDTTTGAFWHGVMHRREGDFSNAKYWFRHVVSHSVFEELAQGVAELSLDGDDRGVAARIASNRGGYDPFAMVDACQAALRAGGPGADFCRRVQQAEWELLFDYSYRHAIGA